MVPILFPLLAFALPVFVLYREKNKPVKRPYLLSLASFSCAMVALMQELFVVKRRAFAGDYGGIEDTIVAVLIIGGAIIVVTLVLNLVALGVSYEQE